ncbi:MAG: choice-of-anchor D domain-containing protein, partial [Acidimicrobiales bacterium]
MLTCGRVFLVACLTAVAAATTVVVTPNPAGATTPSTIGVDHDQAGTSWYPDQTALTPQLVQGGSFGQLFGTQLQGDIQAQPLVADGVLLVETEGNWAYGLNPASGAIEWSKYLGTPFDSASLGCPDLPSDGVTGTPVVDTSTNIEYFTSVTYASGTSGPAQYWMHALSVTNGQEEPGFPALISGNASNDPNQSFNATYQLQRPGLLLMNGVVYAGFGSHCDIAPTNGWVIGVTTGGAISTRWSSEAGIDSGDGLGGIWAPGALRSDGPGQILLSTGNGYDPTAPAAGNSNPEPSQLAEAVVRLTVQPNGSLQTTDFFVPLDAAALNQTDGDLGSGSPVVLPSEFSTSKYPELAVEIGKEGYLYVLDASALGGYEQGPDGSDRVLARLGPVQGVWGSPAVWGGDGGYLYVVTNGGSADGAPGATDGKLLAWKFGVDGSGNPTFALVGSSTDAFGYSSSSPVVTSSGTTSGTNILWVNWADGPGSTTAQLRAYNPIPDATGNLDLLWSAPSGASVKLSEPGVGGNRVYVGGFDGVIRGFGSPVASPLSGGSLGFSNTVVGQSSTLSDTFTATTAITVTGVSVSGSAYAIGSTTPALPASLGAGQTLSLPVKFSPTTYGIAGGVLTVATSAGNYSVGLDGTGLNATALLTSSPTTISYEGTPIGSSVTEDAVFTNQGSQSLTITGATLPGAPFSVSGLPPDGTVLAPGGSVSVSCTFSPTAVGSFLDGLTLQSDTGGSSSVNLSGTAGTPAQLQVSPTSLAYGTVPVGEASTATFVVTNVGGTPLSITKSKPPGEGEFTANTQLAEGTTIQAGQSVTESVTFTPTGAGAFTDSWPLNGTGNSALTTVTFTGIGTTPGKVPLSNWKLHGNAQVSGSTLDLTNTGTTFEAGSAVSPVSVPTNGLTVAFDAVIGG